MGVRIEFCSIIALSWAQTRIAASAYRPCSRVSTEVTVPKQERFGPVLAMIRDERLRRRPRGTAVRSDPMDTSRRGLSPPIQNQPCL